jgi:CHAT domain-containing protein
VSTTIRRPVLLAVLVLAFISTNPAQEKSPEDELAASLIAAKTETDRSALLEQKKDLLTARLATALLAQADRMKVRGNPAGSLAVYDLAESVAARVSDNVLVSNILSAKSDAYLTMSDFPNGLLSAELSLKAAQTSGNRAAEARALAVQGSGLYLMGERARALTLIDKSLVLRRQLNDKAALSQSLIRLGSFYNEQGDYSRAMEYFQEALQLLEELKNKRGLAAVFSSIGLTHYNQGNYTVARDLLQKSLALSREMGDKEGIGRALYNMGITYGAEGNNEELALKYFLEVLEIAESIGARGPKAFTLLSIGNRYVNMGRYDLALEHFNKSLEISREIGDLSTVLDAQSFIAAVYLKRKEYQKVIELTSRAIPQVREMNDLERLWTLLYKAGQAHIGLNQPEPARQMFAETIGVLELMRSQVAGGAQDTQRFIQERIGPYYSMTELLISQNKFAEALDFTERAKGRVLLDVLQSGRLSVNKSMTAEEQARERSLTNDLVALNSQLTAAKQQPQPDARRVAELESQLQRTRLDHEAFETGLYVSHPELRLKRGLAQTVNLRKAAQLLPDAKSALIEYAVTNERVFLFVLTKGGSADADLKVYPIDITREVLAQSVENFRRMLAERDPAFKEPARKLYDLLLAPARAQLQGKDSLVIVPDGALWELPFQALQSGRDRFLLEESALFYAPSLSVLYEMSNHRKAGAPSTSTLLAFGNPAFGDAAAERSKLVLRSGTRPVPLPEAEREVKALGEIYGQRNSKIYIGVEAKEERAKADASNFRVLHFATHGVLNNSSPMYSHLLLSPGSADQDGLLEAWEFMRLDLNADLVVLSACETARGRVGAGEGMIGLTWAIFVAGSPATVVSQWKVDSAATSNLMVDFHRNLRGSPASAKRRMTKAEALRQAALKVMRSSEYRHPFNWAAFVVVGDGR